VIFFVLSIYLITIFIIIFVFTQSRPSLERPSMLKAICSVVIILLSIHCQSVNLLHLHPSH
jgi:hypothetical protein